MWKSGFGTCRKVRKVRNVPKRVERIRTCRKVLDRNVTYWNVSKRARKYRKYQKIRQSVAMACSGMAIATD